MHELLGNGDMLSDHSPGSSATDPSGLHR